jgi:uncharacterized SAM-binding protein YcdF (DUF218 family)
MSMTRLLRLMGALVVVAFFVAAFTPLPNALNRWVGVSPQLEPAAAVVVLASGLHADGSLSDRSLRRALYGMVLYQKGFAPLLVFSGPMDHDVGHTEADVRADMARLFGISPAAIVTEGTARTTREEAARLAGLLHPWGMHRILLVTNYEHMLRSRLLFERAGFMVLAAPVGDMTSFRTPEARLRLVRQLSQEFLARSYHRLAGYL